MEGCCFLQLIKGRRETGAGKNYQQGDTTPLGSRRNPFQTPRRTELPLEKGKTAVQGQERGGDRLQQDMPYRQQAPFSQGPLFVKSPSLSVFCLIWRSPNLNANFSRSEDWLPCVSELWGKVAKLPNLFFFFEN